MPTRAAPCMHPGCAARIVTSIGQQCWSDCSCSIRKKHRKRIDGSAMASRPLASRASFLVAQWAAACWWCWCCCLLMGTISSLKHCSTSPGCESGNWSSRTPHSVPLPTCSTSSFCLLMLLHLRCTGAAVMCSKAVVCSCRLQATKHKGVASPPASEDGAATAQDPELGSAGDGAIGDPAAAHIAP